MIRAALRSVLPSPAPRAPRSSSHHQGNSSSGTYPNSSSGNRPYSSSQAPYTTSTTAISASAPQNVRRSSQDSDIIRAPIRGNANSSSTQGSSSSNQGHANGASVGSSSSANLSDKPLPQFPAKQTFEPIVESMAIGTDEDEEEGDDDLYEDREGSDDDDATFTSGSVDDSSHTNNATPATPSSWLHRGSVTSTATLSQDGTPQTSDLHPGAMSRTSTRRSRRRRSRLHSTSDNHRVVEEQTRCPVCNRRFDPAMTEADHEEHITLCLKAAEFSGSPEQTHRPNRMVIYRLPEKEAQTLEECVICLEDFNTGDCVGRLECFCVYHERCILDWFARKGAGECPVHAVHT